MKKIKGGILLSRKKKIVVGVAMLVAIVASFFGGQTFSKYVTEVKGAGTANVASWSFKVNEKEEQIQNISLASTVNNETLVDNKIAPGTKGGFDIKIDGTGSDVGIDYKIVFSNERNKPTNLVFTYGNQKYSSISEIADAANGVINANDANKVKTIHIDWEWPYVTGENSTAIAANDKTDTNDGKNITNYTFDITVTGTQVMPNA